MLDIKQFNKTTFDFNGTYNPLKTLISAAILYIAVSYGVDLLRMTGSLVYLFSPLAIILLLVASVFIVFGVIALNNRKLQVVYAIFCAAVSVDILQKYSLVGEYDWRWWLGFIVFIFVWAVLLYLLWRYRIIRQSSQCVLATIAIILLIQPVSQTIVKLFAVAF